MTAKKNNAETETTLPAEFNQEFTRIDGGDIPPGWAPQLSQKNSKVVDAERLERIKNGAIESTADMVIGTLIRVSAWNRPCYALKDAVDSEGKRFPILRMPESTVLFESFAWKKDNAQVRISFLGYVKVEKGYAIRYGVDLRDMSYQLKERRPDALRLASEAERELMEKAKELQVAYRETLLKTKVQRLENRIAGVLTDGAEGNDPDFIDAEFSA